MHTIIRRSQSIYLFLNPISTCQSTRTHKLAQAISSRLMPEAYRTFPTQPKRDNFVKLRYRTPPKPNKGDKRTTSWKQATRSVSPWDLA
ncbi:MAG: hypothetical protein VKN72_02630 [Nostocales cyanobacterium 94392]|nr:hypothetical protein [Nostocales cyanobacterium 94392]